MKTMEPGSRLRLLRILTILQNGTDEAHHMRAQALREKIEEEGFACDRRTFSGDMQALEKANFSIKQQAAGHSFEYWCQGTRFTDSEAKLLMDTIRCSAHIPPKMTESIAQKIALLIRADGGGALIETGCSCGVKTPNDDMAESVAVIGRAIVDKKKIQFQKISYTTDPRHVELCYDGKYTIVTPLATTVYNGQYYMYAYSPSHKDTIVHYRIDRLRNVEESEQNADCNDVIQNFNPKDAGKEMFSMYGSERKERVRICFAKEITNVLVDKFGVDFSAHVRADGWCETTQMVQVSQTFFGWCCTLGDKIYIEEPKSAATAYKEYLEKCSALYQNLSAPPQATQEQNRSGKP